MGATATIVGVVEGKSAFGIKVNGKWYNPNKFASPKPDFSGVSKGVTVTMEVSGDKYISSLSVDGSAAPSTMTTATTPAIAPMTRHSYKNADREEIARSTAVKAVLGSTVLHSVFEAEADKTKVAVECRKLINEVTNYILTGDWHETIVKEVAKEEVPF